MVLTLKAYEAKVWSLRRRGSTSDGFRILCSTQGARSCYYCVSGLRVILNPSTVIKHTGEKVTSRIWVDGYLVEVLYLLFVALAIS